MRAGLLADKYVADEHPPRELASIRRAARQAFIKGYHAARDDASRTVRNFQCGHSCGCMDLVVDRIESL